MGRKSSVSMEAKMAVVLVALKGEESMGVLARRHGITSTTLARWKSEFLEGGRKALEGRCTTSSSGRMHLE